MAKSPGAGRDRPLRSGTANRDTFYYLDLLSCGPQAAPPTVDNLSPKVYCRISFSPTPLRGKMPLMDTSETDSAPAVVTTGRPRPRDGVAPARHEQELIPPYDLGAEMALLGSMLIDPQVLGPVFLILDSPACFFSHQNAVIFTTIREMFEKNLPVEPRSVMGVLDSKKQLDEAGGYDHLAELINSVPSGVNAEYYARVVHDKSLLRRLINACNQTVNDCYESPDAPGIILDRGEKRIFDIAQLKITGKPAPLSEILNETFEILDRTRGEHYSGIPTGFVEIDNLLSGMQRGEMIVLAARPSVGKTALAMNIVEHVSVNLGKPSAVFSLEMSKQQLAQRLLCSRSGVDSHSLRRGTLSREDRDRLHLAVGELDRGRVFVDDSPGLTVLDLRTKCRRLYMQHQIEFIMIDYLQLMEAPREESRQQQISTISRGIKALARELNVPVLCLSQLNRSSEQDQRRPRTSDLRESGSIEQDADVVMLLHREAVMRRGDAQWFEENQDKVNEAELIVAKQRNGPCDTVKLTFVSGSTRFETYNPGYSAAAM